MSVWWRRSLQANMCLASPPHQKPLESVRIAVDAVLRPPHYTRGASSTEKSVYHDTWPKPPIWPEDLPLIRALLTDEEYAEQKLKVPNAARMLTAL